jgi:hypothetical protein
VKTMNDKQFQDELKTIKEIGEKILDVVKLKQEHAVTFHIMFNQDKGAFRKKTIDELKKNTGFDGIDTKIKGVYVLRGDGKFLYVGMCGDLLKRLTQHNDSAIGQGPKKENKKYRETFEPYLISMAQIEVLFFKYNGPANILHSFESALKFRYEPAFWNR